MLPQLFPTPFHIGDVSLFSIFSDAIYVFSPIQTKFIEPLKSLAQCLAANRQTIHCCFSSPTSEISFKDVVPRVPNAEKKKRLKILD